VRNALALPLVLLGWAAGQMPPETSPPHDVNRLQTDESSDFREAVFDGDPQHPWNRLRRLFYSRITQDGKVYGQESLEPLFVPGSKFLTEAPFYRQATTLLDEFLKERCDERIKDPLKRAILQRDLWATFSTTVPDAQLVVSVDVQRGRISNTDRFEDSGDGDMPEEQRARRRDLQKRLVQIMRRIALKPGEVGALPDNLTQAGKVGAFPKTFDPKGPDQAFLPTDLLSKDGSWVAVSNLTHANEEFLAAPEHVRFTKGRSIFVVFLRLPGGRRATEDFLKKMRNGDLAQFPEGTQTALLRRMLLIDTLGMLRESPLTESLQIRVYRKLDQGIPFEYTLRRSDLFAGRSGGLHAVEADETSYFDFHTRGGDVFEMPKLPPAEPIIHTCIRCHSKLDSRGEIQGGIHTVSTIYARGEAGQKPTGLWPTTMNLEVRRTIDWTRKSYTWGLLQGLWAAQAGE
jgi:hypothetical protein